MKIKKIKAPTGTEDVVRMEDIKIPQIYGFSRIKRFKIQKIIDYYNKHGCIDKPISIIAETNEKNLPNKLLLVDEYSRYIALKILNIESAPIKYIDIRDYNIEQ